MFKWQKGKQGTGYFKLPIIELSFFDFWIIDYPINSFIPTHTDPIPGKKHYRLNIRLYGEDGFVGKNIFKLWRVYFFRPDLEPHSVEAVKTRRILLSFGFFK
jgi:hypothetical protein